MCFSEYGNNNSRLSVIFVVLTVMLTTMRTSRLKRFFFLGGGVAIYFISLKEFEIRSENPPGRQESNVVPGHGGPVRAKLIWT